MLFRSQITEEARRLSGMADMKISDMSSQAPVGTTLALLERQLKTMGAVQARIHAAMKEEFKLLKEIIREYTSPDYSYVPQDGTPQVKAEDYDIVEVIPVSDPNASTMAQRVVQYQAALQLAQGAPQLYDMPRLHRQMLDVLGIPNADKLVPLKFMPACRIQLTIDNLANIYYAATTTPTSLAITNLDRKSTRLNSSHT